MLPTCWISRGLEHFGHLQKASGSLLCLLRVCGTHLEHKDEIGGKMGEGDLTVLSSPAITVWSFEKKTTTRMDGNGADLPNEENG